MTSVSTRLWFTLSIFLLATAATGIVAQNSDYKTPRTENGQPDLQGVWDFASGVPLERPPAFAGKKLFTKEEFEQQRAATLKGHEAIARLLLETGIEWVDDTIHVDDLRTSLITYPDDGRLPALVEGVRRLPRLEDFLGGLSGATGSAPPASLQLIAAVGAGGRKDSHLDFNAAERCLRVAEVPFVPQATDNYVQIIQARDFVVLLTEFDRRLIAIDAPSTSLKGVRSPVNGARRGWTGTSRGHWERDTLVIETKDFNGRTPSFAGAGTSLDKVVTERITRTARDVLTYSATIVDPKTFRDRIELSFPMAQVNTRLYESACHEGNRSLPNTLSGARKEDEARPRQQLMVFDRQGTVVHRVGEAGVYAQAAFSPDGSKLAVIGEGASQDVWVVDIATGGRTAVTSDAFQDRSPVWSPDGSRIAYVSTRGNTSAIYQRLSNGQGNEELLYRHEAGGLIVLTDWAPDGRFLCFWSGDAMFLLPVSGNRTPIALGPGEWFGRGGRFSPDGGLLAFGSNQSGRFEVYVKELGSNPETPPASARAQVSSDGGTGGIVWRRDGKELFYLSQAGQAIMSVEILNRSPLRLAAPRLLFKIPSAISTPAQLSSVASADGQQFVFALNVPSRAGSK